MSSPCCFRCGTSLGLEHGNVGRGETCARCGTDVRVCRNCRHYDEASYNECREPVAERVVEKDKANFCDYFFLGDAEVRSSGASKEETLKKLDSLFK